MQIDRMPLADIGNASLIAKEILSQLSTVPIPMPIEELAAAVDITDIREVQTDGFQGALITPDHKQDGVILVNRRGGPERRRFTIGHELGHYLNFWHKPPDGGFKCTTKDMFAQGDGSNARWKMEAEANVFSAEILMPEKQFKQDIRKLTSPGLEHIVEIAGRYETSKLATARRFVDLSDEVSAIVLSKDGVIEQIHRHKEFPFISLQRGQALPRQSLSRTFDGGSDGCSNTDATEAALWCSGALRRGTEMCEQVLLQNNGYRLTLLSLDESEAEDEDDDEERERSDRNPRFRR